MAYKKHNIVNSQFVHIEQTPASIGYRMLAYFIDFVIIGFYYTGLFTFEKFLSGLSDFDVGVFVLVVILLLPVFYHPIFEQLFNGCSPGKAAVGIRVVTLNGQSVPITSSVLRWLLGFLDFDAGFFGLVVMICNKRNQRLGDLAAGTIVIKEGKYHHAIDHLQIFTSISEKYQPTYPFAAELTWGQVSFINKTAVPRGKSLARGSLRWENIQLLAKKIASINNIEYDPENANSFLLTLVNDYNYYTWHDNV